MPSVLQKQETVELALFAGRYRQQHAYSPQNELIWYNTRTEELVTAVSTLQLTHQHHL